VEWFEALHESEQLSVGRVIDLLEVHGPALAFPYSSAIEGSKLNHLRELRVQHEGRPYRVLYAFDPARVAFLLLGGDKTGDRRWYEKMIPRAEKIYAQHLKEMPPV
jgi:hypothetical protein